MNVLDGIARMVRAYPERPALVTRTRAYTFRGMWREVGAVAAQFAARGVTEGDVVCLARLSVHSHFLAILALARIGAVSLSQPPAMPSEARMRLARRAGARFGVQGAGDLFVTGEGFTAIDEAAIRERPAGEGKAPAMQRGLDDKPWRINLSSGTTGSPKLIAWTHLQRAKLQHNTLDSFNGGPCERMMVCADLAIGYALGRALTQLDSGGVVILAESAAAKTWLPIIERDKPTSLVTTTALAPKLAEAAQARGAEGPLPGLAMVLVGGSPVPPALMQSLEQHVCPNVVVSYGSTELGSTARSEPWSRLVHPKSAGRVVPWIEAQAVDAEHRPLGFGEEGRLRFRARYGAMASGYLGDPEATAAAFVDGWFYPGDIGALSIDGFLYLRGRVDERVNVGGNKVDPARVEQALMALPGVTDCAVVPLTLSDGRARLAVAVVAGEGFVGKDVAERVRQEGGGRAMVVKVKTLPRNEGGKVMRKELATRLQKVVEARSGGGGDEA
ncbi:MAG: acyl--CoA ligase [Burkholderiales bacterium]|nr:acyl--CoA ligase [Burkholderiales bacterium]